MVLDCVVVGMMVVLPVGVVKEGTVLKVFV